MVDRHGARKVIFTGAIVAGLGFTLLSQMSNLWQFYVGYAFIGVGMAALGYVPASVVVSNWFKKRRGLAVGLMSSGIGVGGFVIAPLVGGYLIPGFGWRASYFALALLTWVFMIPSALFVIKTRPSDMGLYPDGIKPAEAVASTKVSSPTPQGLTLTMALTTSAFWLIAISFLLNHFSHGGTIQNQVPHLNDIGFPVTIAATALGSVALGSAVGKLGFGWLCDWIPAKYALAIGLCFQLMSIIVLVSIKPESPVVLIWLYAILMGLGVGSWLPTMSMVVSSTFGLASFGAIFGAITLAQSIGNATGPAMAGFMYDSMNTYHWPFVIFILLYLIAIPAILLVRRPRITA